MTLPELGPLLRSARKQAGLSQTRLAQPLGMSRATISALEGGRCEEIGFAKLAAILPHSKKIRDRHNGRSL